MLHSDIRLEQKSFSSAFPRDDKISQNADAYMSTGEKDLDWTKVL